MRLRHGHSAVALVIAGSAVLAGCHRDESEPAPPLSRSEYSGRMRRDELRRTSAIITDLLYRQAAAEQVLLAAHEWRERGLEWTWLRLDDNIEWTPGRLRGDAVRLCVRDGDATARDVALREIEAASW